MPIIDDVFLRDPEQGQRSAVLGHGNEPDAGQPQETGRVLDGRKGVGERLFYQIEIRLVGVIVSRMRGVGLMRRLPLSRRLGVVAATGARCGSKGWKW